MVSTISFIFPPDLSGKWSLDYSFIFFKWVGSIQPPIRKKTSLDEVEAEDGNVKLWCRGSSDQIKWLIFFFSEMEPALGVFQSRNFANSNFKAFNQPNPW